MIDWPQDIPADFAIAGKIHFELDSLNKVASYISSFSSGQFQKSRLLIVSAREDKVPSDSLNSFLDSFKANSLNAILYQDLLGSPDTEQVDSATFFAKKTFIDAVVIFGSIHSFHLAKAVAVLAKNFLFAENLTETSLDLDKSVLPIFVVPYKTSMGEECLRGFSLINSKTKYPFYFQSDFLCPQKIYYDPSLCSHLKSLDVARNLGALMAYAVDLSFSKRNNSSTYKLLEEVFFILKTSGEKLYNEPRNKEYVYNIWQASSMLGVVMSVVQPGAIWAIARTLSAEAQVDFFITMGMMLPYIMEYFLTTASSEMMKLAKWLQEDTSELSVIEASIKAVESIRLFQSFLKNPVSLRELEVSQESFTVIAEKATRLPQIKNAPKELKTNEIEEILLSAFL